MNLDDPDGDKLIYDLSKLCEAAYQRRRKDAARELGMRVDVLDKIVRHARAASRRRCHRAAALERRAVAASSRWRRSSSTTSRRSSAATSSCPRAPPRRSRSGRCMPGRRMPATSRRSWCWSRRPSAAARRAC